MTLEYCKKMNKPWIVYSLDKNVAAANRDLFNWTKDHGIITLNVAGNRESSSPGVYNMVYKVLVRFYDDYFS